MGFTKKSASVAVAIALSTATVMADEQLVQLESFSGVAVGTGMVAEVVCGGDNSVTLKGKKKVLDDIVVEIRNDKLIVQRSSDAGSIISKIFSGGNGNDGYVEAVISTSSDLSIIDTSTGASIFVPECAVNVSSLEVDASTGSTVNVSGITSQLTLDLSTGATFNSKSGPLTVDNAMIDLSTGATANLCGAATVTGDASTGAMVYVGSDAVVDVDKSVGADTSSRRCR